MIQTTEFEEIMNKANKLPDEYKDALLVVVNQFLNLAKQDHGKALVGVDDGKFAVPEDINVYDDEIAKMFGVN